MRTRLLACGALLSCGSGEATTGSPPPEGFPWLARSFSLRTEIAVVDCPATRAPWAPGFAVLMLVQEGTRVTATLEAADETARAIALEGCLVDAGEGRFALRLSGSTRSTATAGESGCSARLALPVSLGVAVDRVEAAARAAGESGTSLEAEESAWLAAGCPAPDDSTAYPHFELAVCDTGELSGTVDAQLAWSGAACHEGAPCTLGLAIEAFVATPHPGPPAGALLGGPCD
jgi:hypothetical protein